MLCIEVLSPDDTMSRTLVRVREFLEMGVPEVWVFDPETHLVHVCTASDIKDRKDGSLLVPSSACEISVADVFSVLHRGPNIYPH